MGPSATFFLFPRFVFCSAAWDAVERRGGAAASIINARSHL